MTTQKTDNQGNRTNENDQSDSFQSMNYEHDPLCPCYYKDTQMLPRWEERCQCDLIAEADARARADEREKAAQRVLSLNVPGYTTWDWHGVNLKDKAAVKKWETTHGHDIRLKCYAEYGCLLLLDPEDVLAAVRGES